MALDQNTLDSLFRRSPALANPAVTLKQRRPSGRLRAGVNELQCMKALAMFGHARTSEVSRLVWPEAKYGEQMANRTLARLEKSALLLRRLNACGSTSWVITRKGAAWLEERGVRARHTLDLSSVSGSSFAHRTLATRFLIEQRLAGFAIAGEYQLTAPALPFNIEGLCRRLAKASDGLYWRTGARGQVDVWWTEVENAPKALGGLDRVLAVAEQVGTSLGSSARLAGLTVVADASLHHATRLLRAAAQRWSGRDAATRATLESRVQLVLVDVRPPLVWAAHRTYTLHELRQRGRV